MDGKVLWLLYGNIISWRWDYNVTVELKNTKISVIFSSLSFSSSLWHQKQQETNYLYLYTSRLFSFR